VAKAVNISANHLSEKFKQVTGVNFVEYIARTWLKNACDLWRNSNLITEIAFMVGFQITPAIQSRFPNNFPRNHQFNTAPLRVCCDGVDKIPTGALKKIKKKSCHDFIFLATLAIRVAFAVNSMDPW
jgi:hypothetical protein